MSRPILWQPQPRQALFMSRPEDEALYGGAAGGGKSDALVIEALRQVHIPHYKGLILRKTYPQLTELIDKSLAYYPRAVPGARYRMGDHSWTFPSGARVYFGSLQHDKDKFNYQGKAFDYIAFDELTQFSYEEYSYLLSRNRANGPGTRLYMRATANPGGVGHGWVKERFVSAAAPMSTIWETGIVRHPDGRQEKRHRSRIFVPSTVFDNRALLANDPDYLARLSMLPDAERKALLYGDWDSFHGQVFTEWRNDPEHYEDRIGTHVIAPFDPPTYWTYYRSFDWGYSKPFSVGWYAVDFDGRLYRILEWYGCREGQPNVGIEMPADELFSKIAETERTHPYLKGRKIYGVADPAIWSSDGGISIAETAERRRVYFEKGDHTRIPGWQQVHNRLRFDENGRPMLYVFSTCRHCTRVLPAMVYSTRNVEDLDTTLEDHIPDELRYMCMLRPIEPKQPRNGVRWEDSPLYYALGFSKRSFYNT